MIWLRPITLHCTPCRLPIYLRPSTYTIASPPASCLRWPVCRAGSGEPMRVLGSSSGLSLTHSPEADGIPKAPPYQRLPSVHAALCWGRVILVL